MELPNKKVTITKPKLSVVIPTYNEGKYIERALSSLKESLKNYDHEIIVVDSYSNDGTLDIAKKYANEILLVPKGNIGLARDYGFKKARGDIIISASADNTFTPEYFRKLIRPIIEGRADITMGAVEMERANRLERLSNKMLNRVLIPAVFKLNMTFSIGDSMAFTREVYEKIGFPKTPTAEDVLFLKWAKRAGLKIEYVKDATITTSDRRLRKWGALKFMMFHSKNFIKANLMGKYEEEYEVVR